MAEQQYEYCQLWLKEAVEMKPGFRDKWLRGISHDCSINYCSSVGQENRRQLSVSNASPIGFDPFLKAMALLGTFGWELVSVQHGNGSNGTGSSWHSLEWDNAVAYFKRPVISGRAVDEPKLVL